MCAYINVIIVDNQVCWEEARSDENAFRKALLHLDFFGKALLHHSLLTLKGQMKCVCFSETICGTLLRATYHHRKGHQI